MEATKGWDYFYGGSWPLKIPDKDFNFTIVGELGWMKWLKNSMQLFLLYILSVKILLVMLKYLYIQCAWISIMKKQNSNQNGKVEKMLVLAKTFDQYQNKFQLFQLYCKIVKECETEI